jgi:hypothetical protein
MVPWSLLTVHRILAIALQFMRGFYDGKQRPLTSNTTQKMQFVKFQILESEKKPNNLVRILKFGQRVFSKNL